MVFLNLALLLNQPQSFRLSEGSLTASVICPLYLALKFHYGDAQKGFQFCQG